MAKRMRSGGRGISTPNFTANARRVARPIGPVVLPTTTTLTPIRNSLADRRLFRPDVTFHPLSAVRKAHTRIVAVDKFGESIRRQTKAPLRFAVPEKVSICIKRNQRKEVLHAKRKTGPGKKVRKPTRNFWSSISCKR